MESWRTALQGRVKVSKFGHNMFKDAGDVKKKKLKKYKVKIVRLNYLSPTVLKTNKKKSYWQQC